MTAFIVGGTNGQSGCGFDIDVSRNPEDGYLIGHKIDGRVLFPATGYLTLAWKTLAKHEGKHWEEMTVVFEDVDIHRATILPDHGMMLQENKNVYNYYTIYFLQCD